MNEIQKLLKRQAEWQKSRKSLSWPEKIRMAEAIRESVLQFRRTFTPEESEPSATPSGRRDESLTGLDRG